MAIKTNILKHSEEGEAYCSVQKKLVNDSVEVQIQIYIFVIQYKRSCANLSFN